MSNIFLLHDLEEENESILLNQFNGEIICFSAKPRIKKCIGCFGCWVKTPGKCIIKDRGEVLPSLWGSSRHVIVVSQLFYGGFSPSIKTCIDRSLGYILPYFRIINGEMHHQLRYNNEFELHAFFYGDSRTYDEENTAVQLVKANSLNYGAKDSYSYFSNTIDEVGNLLYENNMSEWKS